MRPAVRYNFLQGECFESYFDNYRGIKITQENEKESLKTLGTDSIPTKTKNIYEHRRNMQSNWSKKKQASFSSHFPSSVGCIHWELTTTGQYFVWQTLHILITRHLYQVGDTLCPKSHTSVSILHCSRPFCSILTLNSTWTALCRRSYNCVS